MKNLDTPEKQAAAVVNAKAFMADPFWKIIVDIVKNDVALIKNRLATEEFENVSEIRILQNKIIAYEEVIGTPEMIIEKYDPDYQTPDTTAESIDPYESLTEFRVNMRRARKAS